jgi:hypothetical protein
MAILSVAIIYKYFPKESAGISMFKVIMVIINLRYKPDSTVRFFVSFQRSDVFVVLATFLANVGAALDVCCLDVMFQLGTIQLRNYIIVELHTKQNEYLNRPKILRIFNVETSSLYPHVQN